MFSVSVFFRVLQINQVFGFWEWVDPKMCEHGEGGSSFAAKASKFD